MKPLKLSISAFGPYTSTQIIDFRELGDRSFFLIHGPTGAGKTTILDAICYALYGETSGDERKGEQMRSQNAKPSLLTRIEFEFTLGQDVYYVMRQPKQEKLNERGGKVVSVQQKATLVRKTDANNPPNTDIPVASTWREVTEKVKELFGFESDQFRQVIMLPQDKFRQLLRANSDEREEVFKTLFQTEQFERIALTLKAEAKSLEDEIRTLRSKKELLLGQAHASSDHELISLQQLAQDGLEKMRKELVSLRKDETAAQDSLKRGEEDARKLAEKFDAETGLHKLELRQHEFEEKRSVLESARKASVLFEVESNLSHQAQEATNAERKSNQARLDHEKAAQRHHAALELLLSEENRGAEREEARRHYEELKALYNKVKESESAQYDLAQANVAVDTLAHKFTATGAEQGDLQNQIEKLQQSLQESETIAAQVEGFRIAVEHAQGIYQQRKRLSVLITELEAEKRQYSKLEINLKQAETKIEQVREAEYRIEAAWLGGQAAVLAQRLTAGQPCPVCGSAHHPQPAMTHEHLPSESDLKQCRDEAAQLQTALEVARGDLSVQRDRVVKLEAEKESLDNTLGLKKDVTLEQCGSELTVARETLRKGEECKKQKSILATDVLAIQRKLASVETDLGVLDQQLQDARNRQTSARTLVDERIRGIPEGLRDLDAVVKAGKEAGAKLQVLEQSFERARENAGRSESDLAAAKAMCLQLSEQAVAARLRAEQLDQEFVQRVQEVGFQDVNAYRGAKRQKRDIDLLDQEIGAFAANLQAARNRTERAYADAENLSEPDLQALRSASEQARSRVDEVVQEEARLVQKLLQVSEQLNNVRRISDELFRCEQKYEVIGRIAEVANGKNNLNMTFQRFVLAAKMDDVLLSASQRLLAMSSNRYLLQRARSPLTKRRAGGLDLEVTDTWYGENTRAVETLSGGESFLASLALALGLADVVISYSGGIRLDTIFIDEGFGSLDAERLDTAIQTLLDLRQGGRLIGIISHVDSLLERIDTRLEVSTSLHGSTARFVIA